MKLKNWFNNTIPKIKILISLTFIVGIASFLRFYQIGKLSFWTDEILTMRYVSYDLKDMLQFLWPKEMNMTLYYIIAHMWLKLFPTGLEATLRSISAIFSIASIPVVFYLGKILHEDKKKASLIGLISAILLSFNAYHVQFAQEMRSYSLTFLLATLSTYLFINAVEKSNWSRWLGYVFVSVLAVYSHIFVVFLLFAQFISLAILFTQKDYKFPFVGVIGSGLAILLLISPLIVATKLAGASGLAWIEEPTFESLNYFLNQITGDQGKQLLTLCLIVGGIGLIIERSWLNKNLFAKWKYSLLVSCLFVPPITLLIISHYWSPIFINRYLLFIMPYLLIFIAIGITNFIISEFKIFKIIGVIVLISIICFSILGVKNYFLQYQKEDWRGLSQYMTSNCLATEDFRLYYVTWISNFTSYYNQNLKSQDEAVQKSLNNSNSEQIANMLPIDYKKVCLVLGQNWATKDKIQTKNIRDALSTKFTKKTQVKFYQLELYVYEK